MAKTKISIRKVLLAFAWMIVGGALLTVLIMAIRKTDQANCLGLKIELGKENKKRFVEEKDVLVLMGVANRKAFTGKSMKNIDLRNLENRLKKFSWVADAELFFNADRQLVVEISERVPVARIYTSSGASCYMDSSGMYLPLVADKPPVHLPVFTGMPEKLMKKRPGDSSLIAAVTEIAGLMKEDEFWNAQIEQVVYTPEKKLEMIPLVGNHRVVLGERELLVKKFRRLKLFYEQVLTKTGFDYYTLIDVSFAHQVIGTKAERISTPVDKFKLPYSLTVTPLQVSSPISSETSSRVHAIPVSANVHPVPKAVMRRL